MKHFWTFGLVVVALAGGILFVALAVSGSGQTPERFNLDLNAPSVFVEAAGAIATDRDGSRLLHFSLDSPQRNDVRMFLLPTELLRGHRVRVKAEIEARDVSEKPIASNGIKIMLRIDTPALTLYPQLGVPTGSFSWQSFSGLLAVPADATRVTLVVGLEKVSGTIGVRNISFAPVESPRTEQVAGGGTVFTGHTAQGLRGAMVKPQSLTRADFDILTRTWGANLVRWQLVRSRQEPKDFPSYETWLETRLVELDRGLTWAAANGTKVVVDLHSPPDGGDNPGGYQDASGNLFSAREAQDHFVEVWQQIATRYRGNNTIWGFDLVNEPDDTGTTGDCLDWNGLALRAARAIRTIDPTRVLIVESPNHGSPEGLEWLRPLPMYRVVYSFHMYQPAAFTTQGAHPPSGPISYPGTFSGRLWNRGALVQALQPAITFAQKYHAQIYVGEFGAVRWAPGGDRYLADLIDIFEEQHWDWSLHAFRESQTWNYELGNDPASNVPTTVETPQVKLFKQAFARNLK